MESGEVIFIEVAGRMEWLWAEAKKEVDKEKENTDKYVWNFN